MQQDADRTTNSHHANETVHSLNEGRKVVVDQAAALSRALEASRHSQHATQARCPSTGYSVQRM